MQRYEPKHFLREDYYLNHGNENTGQDAFRFAIADACNGSSQLLEATNKAIFKWAFRHGIATDQARVLLLDRRMPA